jgi:hypothetical protein
MRPLRILAIVASVAVLLAGCGTRGSASASTRTPEDQSEFDFVACMRSHGVHMRDPFHRPGHTGLSLEVPGGPASQPAEAKCRHLLKGNIGAKAAFVASPAFLEYNLRLAQCLRDHGEDVPDPTADHPDAEGVGADRRNTPLFQAADQACRQLVPMPTVPGLGK